ncbi:MAG: succinate dehydrogenase, cytochrome b556 subunit, partial [Pseudomonadota bacterium]
MSKQNHEEKRPLSPHLQVYRLPYNALMSISGRAAGIILSVSFVILCALFIAFVWYSPAFEAIMPILEFPVFPYIFLLWAFGAFFYIGNGIRHYLWDHLIG